MIPYSVLGTSRSLFASYLDYTGVCLCLVLNSTFLRDDIVWRTIVYLLVELISYFISVSMYDRWFKLILEVHVCDKTRENESVVPLLYHC